MTAAIFLVFAFLWQTTPAIPADAVIQAELKKEITSRRSHSGQDVRLVVEADLKNADGTVLIPEGAKLSGKLTTVRKHKGDEPAVVSFVVDKAEWKGGSVALNATIDRLLLMGMPGGSAACGPNLNNANMANCGSSAPQVQRVPADCKVDKVDEGMAVVCAKREIELNPGARIDLTINAAKTGS